MTRSFASSIEQIDLNTRQETRLASVASVSGPPLPPYQSAFDTAYPGIQLPQYGNNLYDDCVIAARAHQTVRFDYAAGKTVPNISDQDVTQEYLRESKQQGTEGLVLSTSLREWMTPGWTASGSGPRTIQTFWGPYKIINAAPGSGYPANEMNQFQVMTSIVEYTGVQVDLILPSSIDPRSPSTFGDGTVWSKTSGLRSNPHVMLLTGYDVNGPIGITWGARQHMTWNFLTWCCLGLFVVEMSANT
jgi:hypothetical protein